MTEPADREQQLARTVRTHLARSAVAACALTLKRECSANCGAAPRCRGGAETFRIGRRLRARDSGWEVPC